MQDYARFNPQYLPHENRQQYVYNNPDRQSHTGWLPPPWLGAQKNPNNFVRKCTRRAGLLPVFFRD